jgi:serine/threonine-protein kinase
MGYEVIDFIGEGAASLLYAVTHPETAQIYALKHVKPRSDKDQRFVEQLETEYQVGQLVRHKGLRRSIEMKVNRTLFRKVTEAALVLELFDGQPLESLPLRSTVGVVDIFIQVAEALDALHGIGYVHCDLKPSNILVNAQGDVKVIDLGQACAVGTAKSRIQGTPDYIAPEQVKCAAVSPQTDIYNLGATLYWALTGTHIPTLYTLKRAENSFLVDGQLASPQELNPLVPEQLSNLVMECVRTNAAKRPQGMRDIILRLEIVRHVLRKKSSGSGTGMRPALV